MFYLTVNRPFHTLLLNIIKIVLTVSRSLPGFSLQHYTSQYVLGIPFASAHIQNSIIGNSGYQ